MASPGGSAASRAGVGQRAIHASQAGITRETGVCWSMTSLTRTPHGVPSEVRHGRSRAFASYLATASAARAGAAIARHPATARRRNGRWSKMLRVNELAITVIGHDRPGIIADVAEVLAGLGMNLTDSTMTR